MMMILHSMSTCRLYLKKRKKTVHSVKNDLFIY